MTHTVRISKLVTLLAFCAACVSHQEGEFTDCSSNSPEISIGSSSSPTSCESSDGKIVATGAAGQEPYQFRINDNAYQASSTFEGLGGGTYTITVKDAKGCESSTQATLTIATSNLAATQTSTPDTDCYSDNGSLTINATGDHTPFQYKLGNGAFGTTSAFTGLKGGNYTVIVKDALGCSISVTASVTRGESGTSYSKDIAPLLKSSCGITGCHVSGGRSPNLTVYASTKSNATAVKSTTASRSMPKVGSLTQQQIDMIGCWVDDGAKDN